METFFGKPIDIRTFKPDWLERENLKKMVERYVALAEHVRSSPRRVQVTACYMCSGTSRKAFGAVHDIPYYACEACQHVYADVRLSAEDLAEYYRAGTSYAAQTYANKDRYQYRAREVATPKVEFVTKYVTTARRRWLDIGSGNGDMVYVAQQRGFTAQGLEISQDSINFGKEIFGVDLWPLHVSEVLRTEGPGSFDVISFINSLEHVSDPRAQAEACAELLAPGGLFVIEVPNAGSLGAASDLFFPHNVLRQMFPVFHIMVFTEPSLDYLIDALGLQRVALWRFGLDIYNVVLHLALQHDGFVESRVGQMLLDLHDPLQAAVDQQGKSDTLFMVLRKP